MNNNHIKIVADSFSVLTTLALAAYGALVIVKIVINWIVAGIQKFKERKNS